MEHVALDGLWLLGALGVAFLLGVFFAQKAKDTVNGVPSALRTALKATEASALSQLAKAKADVIADVTKLFTKSAVATAAAAPAAPAASPAAVAAIAAVPVPAKTA